MRNGQCNYISRLIGNTVEIEVKDFGVGIADIELARQPLYTQSRSLKDRDGFHGDGNLYG